MKNLTLLFFVIFGMSNIAFAQDAVEAKNNLDSENKEQVLKVSKSSEGDEKKQFVRAGDILASCKDQFTNTFNTRESISKRASCNGYFFGIGGILVLLQNDGVKTGTCLPGDVSTNEIIQTFLDWAKNPENNLSLPAPEATLQALKLRYKCDDGK